MLEMGELSMERFRGIFKLTYNGDAHIVLQTKVQVKITAKSSMRSYVFLASALIC